MFEQMTSVQSKKTPACPECKSESVERLLSTPGVIFKGSGFYKTDSRGPVPKEKPLEKNAAIPEKHP